MKNTLLFLMLFSISYCTFAQTPDKHFVDKDATGGLNNGSSWSNAYTDLQTAINNAAAGDSIFVKKGRYELTDKISMKEGVKIYGSFEGSELSLLQRDLNMPMASDITKSTILDGGTISISDFANLGGVIINKDNGLTAAAVLDGFVIRGGRNGVEKGGGIYNENVSPTFQNLSIIHNRITGGDPNKSYQGGGMYNLNSNPVLMNTVIAANQIKSEQAGVRVEGGGIYNDNSSPKLTNVAIIGNVIHSTSATPTNVGGTAMMNANNSMPVLTNVAISINVARIATGTSSDNLQTNAVVNNTNSSLTIRNSIIISNNGSVEGVADNSGSSSTVSFSIVQGMESNENGNISASGISASDVFEEPDDAGFAPSWDGNYRLKATSPAIDVGDNSHYEAADGNNTNNSIGNDHDLGGLERLHSGTIDMGPHEFGSDPLSATWGGFSAMLAGNNLLVNWTTLAETGNDYFDIQISADGKTFRSVGTVKSQAPGGNSNEPLHYRFETDYQQAAALMGGAALLLLLGMAMPLRRKAKLLAVAASVLLGSMAVSCVKKDMLSTADNNPIYVRIMQTDIDGSKTYSKVIKATKR